MFVLNVCIEALIINFVYVANRCVNLGGCWWESGGCKQLLLGWVKCQEWILNFTWKLHIVYLGFYFDLIFSEEISDVLKKLSLKIVLQDQRKLFACSARLENFVVKIICDVFLKNLTKIPNFDLIEQHSFVPNLRDHISELFKEDFVIFFSCIL